MLTRLFCRFDTITKVFADGGYTGTLIEWAKEMFGYSIEIVKRKEQHLFQVLPKRWIVERSLAWLNWSRRLSKDYELLHTTAETYDLCCLRSSAFAKACVVFKQILRKPCSFP